MEHIAESALLAHDLQSLSNEEILAAWKDTPSPIAWMEQGKIVIDGIDRFLDFRAKLLGGPVRIGTASPKEEALIAWLTGRRKRADLVTLDHYAAAGADAVLTASGVMAVCAREGIGAAVTAGISGFFPEMLYGRPELLVTKGDGPPDIAALTSLPVALVSCGPKDMFDCEGTFRFLEQHSVLSLGVARDIYTGCLFTGESAKLSGVLSDVKENASCGVLIINEIPEENRIPDRAVLDAVNEYGLEGERQGGSYHTSVNNRLAELTDNRSARIQLQALIDNAHLAAEL